MFERFTDRSRRIVVLAQEQARLLGNDFIGPEHLLLGVLIEHDGVAGRALTSLGVDPVAARAAIIQLLPEGEGEPTGHIPFTARAKKAFELALREALLLGHHQIGTAHILLGVLRADAESDPDDKWPVVAILQLEPAAIRERVIELWRDDEPGRAAHPTETRATSNTTYVGVPAEVHLAESLCHFCGARPPRTGRLVVGKHAFICQSCVEAAIVLFQETDAAGLDRHLAVTDGRLAVERFDPMHSKAAAMQAGEAIGESFYEMTTPSHDDHDLPNVEDGEGLGDRWRAISDELSIVEDVGIEVRGVQFDGSTTATVDFVLFVPRAEAIAMVGTSVRTEGGWRVSRATFDAVLSRFHDAARATRAE